MKRDTYSERGKQRAISVILRIRPCGCPFAYQWQKWVDTCIFQNVWKADKRSGKSETYAVRGVIHMLGY